MFYLPKKVGELFNGQVEACQVTDTHGLDSWDQLLIVECMCQLERLCKCLRLLICMCQAKQRIIASSVTQWEAVNDILLEKILSTAIDIVGSC